MNIDHNDKIPSALDLVLILRAAVVFAAPFIVGLMLIIYTNPLGAITGSVLAGSALVRLRQRF